MKRDVLYYSRQPGRDADDFLGLKRSDGIHAAAVVITRDPLTDYLPIQRKPEAGQDPELAPVVTQ